MTNQWFVVRGGQEQGPVTEQHLKEMAVAGRLLPTDLVRRDDTKTPRQASTIKGLFATNPSSALMSAPMTAKAVTDAQGKIDKSIPVDDLRRRLTVFANRIPHHKSRNLGDSITVLAAKRLAVYRIEWTALFEWREVVQRERPHEGGEDVPRRGFDAKNFSVWEQAIPHATAFKKGTAEVPLRATQQVRGCGQCGTAGAVTCDNCNGKRQVACPNCKGSGAQACGGCLGTGRTVQTYTERLQRHCQGPILAGVPSHCNGGYDKHGRVCSRCNGTGVEWYNHTGMRPAPCPACGTRGRVTCSSCNASGISACHRCQGHGKLTCQTCSGQGKVVQYLAAIQSFEPKISAVIVADKECLHECVKALNEQTDFKDVLKQENLEGELKTGLSGDTGHLSADVQAVRKGLRGQATKSCRLAGERLRIARGSVYRLHYSVDGKPFTAWFSGEGGVVYAPINPLTDSVACLVKEAVAEWSAGRQREGEWLLRKALGMAKASPDCARVMEPLKSRVPNELLRRASSFSLWFWFEHLSTAGKTLVGVPVGCSGLCVLGFCFLCVLGILVDPPNQRKAAVGGAPSAEKRSATDPSEKVGSGLTASFLPCVPGNVKRYEEEVYDPVTGRALVYSEDRVTYGKDNTLIVERTIKSPGVAPSQGSYRAERRESNGFVEIVGIDSRNNNGGSLKVKIGANPGDEWNDGRGEGKYRLIRFDKAVGQGANGPYELLQAVIEHRSEAVDGQGERTVNVTEIVLEREGGVQSEKAYMLFSGQKKLIRHRRLISSTY